MNGKQETSTAFPLKSPESEAERLAATHRPRFREQDRLKQWLRETLDVEAEPTSNRYTHDGITFVVRYLGLFRGDRSGLDEVAYSAGSEWWSYHMEGQCPECERTVLSPPIWDQAHLDSLLNDFRAEAHPCVDAPRAVVLSRRAQDLAVELYTEAGQINVRLHGEVALPDLCQPPLVS